MYGDFNRIVVQLAQHPIMHKPLSDLTYTECELAYALISELIDLSTEGDYTLEVFIRLYLIDYQSYKFYKIARVTNVQQKSEKLFPSYLTLL